jgi:hypothetical protein
MNLNDVVYIKRLQESVNENLNIVNSLIPILEKINKSNPSYTLNTMEVKEIYDSLLDNLKKLVVQSQEQVNITAEMAKIFEKNK